MTTDDLAHAAGGPVRIIEQVSHADLLSFIKRFFWTTRGPVVIAHHALSFALLLSTVAAAAASGSTLAYIVTSLGVAVILFLLPVLPLHELIHDLTYRALGAREVRWTFSWAPLGAYVTAHAFVVNRRAFIILASLPSLVITGGMILMALIVPGLRIPALMLAFLHHGGTAGDWALVNVFYHYRDRTLLTVDDAEEKRSWFFERV
jgi:hypothetical protein